MPRGLACSPGRLQDAGVTNLAVVNEGISGNRVLGDGAGVSVLARFERDVLAQPGIKYLVFMEAINDIGGASRAGATPVTAEEIIAIYKQMIDRAHMRGIKVIGATLTPYEGAAYYSEPGEGIRTAVNQWIRTTGMLDGVVDFDLVTRDPEHRGQVSSGVQYPRQSASQRCRVQGDGGIDRFVVVRSEEALGGGPAERGQFGFEVRQAIRESLTITLVGAVFANRAGRACGGAAGSRTSSRPLAVQG